MVWPLLTLVKALWLWCFVEPEEEGEEGEASPREGQEAWEEVEEAEEGGGLAGDFLLCSDQISHIFQERLFVGLDWVGCVWVVGGSM